MKRLLIVITRMYAHQGDNKDEFVEIWQGAANTEHRVFALQTGSRDDYVLVLHGYEYPQHVEVAAARARGQVETAIRSTDLLPRLRERRTGVIFHPRQSWTPVAQTQIAAGIQVWLRKAGAAVDYIEAYHHGSIIDRKLARACLQRQDFSLTLDELWTLFLRLAVARYERRLDGLTRELEAVLLPICKEFITWRNINSGVVRFENLDDEKNRGALTRARQLVLDECVEGGSVVSLTWEVAEKVDEKKKERLLRVLAELENLFSRDRRYQQAKLALQGSEHDPNASVPEKAFPARKLDALRSKLVESDPLNTWCQAVLKALSDLGQTLHD